jgi:hypothetical protein
MSKRKSKVQITIPDPAQTVIPGVQPVSLVERLNWQAGLPMCPRKPQKPLDIGFWDPMRDQIEMF